MKKVLISEDILKGGKSDKLTIPEIAEKHNTTIVAILQQVITGIAVEREHTDKEALAFEIALDHLSEIPDYYRRLSRMEKDANQK